MSKVVIQGNASGTGNFTIAAPNSNTDRTLTLPDEAGTVITTAGVPSSSLPSGTVLQTVQHLYNDATSIATSYTYTDITNGSKTITSIGDNSKFLITVCVHTYQSAGNGHNIGVNRTVGGTTTRVLGVDGALGDSWLGHANGPGSTHNQSGTITRLYLDSPSQSAGTAITYQTLVSRWTSGTIYVNYTAYDCKSSITIQEIAA